jgi:Protein of unknown function (DUF2808)
MSKYTNLLPKPGFGKNWGRSLGYLSLLALGGLVLHGGLAIAQSRPFSPSLSTPLRSLASSSIPLSRFTITLPARTGQRFARLSLSELNPDLGGAPMPFDLSTTQVFLGTAATGAPLPHQAWIDETGTVWIELAQALPPQTQLTVALHVRTAIASATRIYGVAAYPAIGRPVAVFVGDVELKP